MPFFYENDLEYSEATMTLTSGRDWTRLGVSELSLWFRGHPASVGSFAEGPAGTYTVIGSGADIWNEADEFHYVYRELSGPGSIIAKVESIENTHNWAKAAVMIRDTLDPDSAQAIALTNVWTEWRIELKDFADQGIDLTNIDRVSLGFGDAGNVQAGGSGMVFFDSMRLY